MDIKDAIRAVGWATMAITLLEYARTFMIAYFSGQYAVAVYINNFGEARAEFVWMLIGVPCAVFVLVEKLWMTDFVRGIRER